MYGSRVNLRTGPTTSDEILMVIEQDTEMTRIEKGNGWDRVKLKNGMVGYMSSTYLAEIPKAQIERIEIKLENTTLNKGETTKLDIQIYPIEACNQLVEYSSSNPSVARIDQTGKIQALHSGKTKITVKAVENNVANEVEITVVTRVSKVEMLPKDVYLQVGETANVQAYVLPEDVEQPQVVFQSANSEIASISETGNILAKQEGKTKVIASSKENSEIQAETNVYIVRTIEEGEISFDESLLVQEGVVTGLDSNANTVVEMKEKITTTLEMEIVNYQDEVLQDTDLVGTGCKICIKEDGIILKQYMVILYGDADGNGKINSVDLLVIQRHILEIEKMDVIFCKASNIRKNGKNPSALDLLLIQRHILRMENILQK